MFINTLLFLLAIDWIMKSLTVSWRNGLKWAPWSLLHVDDVDFVDNLALLSVTQA